MIEIGEHIKIHIPGETPWAIVREVINDTTLKVSIDNYVGSAMIKTWNKGASEDMKLDGALHDYEIMDLVYVYWCPEWKQFSTEKNVKI